MNAYLFKLVNQASKQAMCQPTYVLLVVPKQELPDDHAGHAIMHIVLHLKMKTGHFCMGQQGSREQEAGELAPGL